MGKIPKRIYKQADHMVDLVIIMETFKDTIVAAIEHRTLKRAGFLSRQLLKAEPKQKEAVAAGIQIEKELAQACQLSLDDSITD